MRQGIWWTGLTAVLATLLMTGKPCWADDTAANGVQNDEPKAKDAVKVDKKRVIKIQPGQGGKVIELEIGSDGVAVLKKAAAAAADAETDKLRARIQMLEREIKELRALLAQKRETDPVIKLPTPG